MAAQVFGNIMASAKSGYEDIAGSVMEKSSSRKSILKNLLYQNLT